MGDKNNSPPPGIQFLKQRQNLERSTGIQVSRSLIGQNQYRIVHQCPGYSHPLLLSTESSASIARLSRSLAETAGLYINGSSTFSIEVVFGSRL